jgi:hypothetical protein
LLESELRALFDRPSGPGTNTQQIPNAQDALR